MAKIKRNEKIDVVTLNEAFHQFIDEKEAYLSSPSTIATYTFHIQYFISLLGLDGDTAPIKDINEDSIRQFINALNNQDNYIRPTSINAYIRSVRTFLYWAMDPRRKYLEKFQVQSVKAQEEAIKFFTDEEVAVLLAKPTNNATFSEWRNWAVTNWVLATANRVATVCSIKMTHVDFKEKIIYIQKQKNRKAQIIPLSGALETCLKEYIKMWRYDAKLNDYLFCGIDGEKMQSDSMSSSFSRYAKKRGLRKTSIHGLRHTYARLFIKNGGNPLVLQKMLNHSTLDMTKRYVALFSNDLKEEIDLYNPLDVIKKKTSRTQTVKKKRLGMHNF